MRRLLPALVLLAACGDDTAPAIPDARPADAPAASDAGDAAVVDVATVDVVVLVDTCEKPTPISPGTQGGDTRGSAAVHAPRPPSPCTQANGPELAFEYTFVAGADPVDLVWDVSAGFDVVAYARSTCDGRVAGNPVPDALCSDDPSSGSADERVEILAAPSGTYYFFVDGYDASDGGAFTATLTERAIVGLGAPCDGTAARCSDDLVCDGGACISVVAYCAATATGVLTAGVAAAGSTTGEGDDDHCLEDGSSFETAFGEDQLWQFTAPTAGLYNVSVVAPGHVPVLSYLGEDCRRVTDYPACVFVAGAQAVSYDVDLLAGQTIHPVVDSFSTSESSSYSITVALVAFPAVGEACDADHPLVSRCPTGSFCFADTGLCVAMAVEDASNETWATADPVAPAAPIAGTIADDADIDLFVVDVTAGDVLVAGLRQGATMRCDDLLALKQLTIYAPDHTMLAMEKTYGCPVLVVDAAVSGGFFVEVTTVWSTVFDYSLWVHTATPLAVADTEPNDAAGTAQPAAAVAMVTGTVGSVGDVDRFSASFAGGRALSVATVDQGASTCAANTLDSYVELYSGATRVAYNDDLPSSPSGYYFPADNYCSRVLYVPPAAGTLQVLVKHSGYGGSPATFDYRLRIVEIPW